MAKKYGRIAGRGGRDRLTALLLACAMVACSWTVSVHAERDGSSLSGAERTSAESGAEASSAVSGGSEPAAASDGESGAQSAAGSSAPEVSSEGPVSSGETVSSEGQASSGETASGAQAPYELKRQKLAAAVYADETLETKSGGKTAITVEGSLPAGAAVKAYPVRVKLGGAAVLAAYDITVYGPDGAAYQPEQPVRVSISAPELKDAPSVDVYHVEDAPAGEDKAAQSAAGASAPRDDTERDAGAPAEQAAVEQDGVAKAMKATKVAGGVKPESETVEFQAEGFSIYVVTADISDGEAINVANMTAGTIRVGDTVTLYDSNSQWKYYNVNWTPTDSDTVQLSRNTNFSYGTYATVTGKKMGTAQITCQYDNLLGGSQTDTITITVEAKPVLHPVSTVDSWAQGVELYMFDYGLGNGSFSILNPGSTSPSSIEGYGNGTTKEGLLQRVVGSNGFPNTIAWSGYSSRPMSQWFTQNGSRVQEGTYQRANNLFLESYFDKNRTFHYSSAENFAALNGDVTNDGVKSFTVYEELGTPSSDNQRYYQRGNFLPYNTIGKLNASDNTNDYDLEGNKLQDGAPKKGVPLYSMDQAVDFHFGMYMKADFIQPKGGLVPVNTDDPNETEPMKFAFTGDDDMWIYIDGVLVLDIGGIHDAQSGTIDFQTGEVTWTDTPTGATTVTRKTTSLKKMLDAAQIFQTTDSNGNITYTVKKFNDVGEAIDRQIVLKKMENGNYVYADYSKHTIQMFYMERGAGASNLKMDFNLPTIPKNSVSVKKEVEGLNPYWADDDDNEYQMKLFVDDGKGNYSVLSNCSYKIDGGNSSGEPDPTTGEDGTFSLKNGQTAVFSGIDENRNYYVQEVEPDGGISYQAPQFNGQVQDFTDGIAQSETVRVDDNPQMTVVNTAQETGSLRVTKELLGYTDTDSFDADFELHKDGETPAIQTVSYQKDFKDTDASGNKYYDFTGLLPGTYYIVETGPSSLDGKPLVTTYTVGSGGPQKNGSGATAEVTANNAGSIPNILVTNNYLKEYTLPVTGGAGSLPFRVAGAAILAGAAAGLGFFLRRGKKKKGGPPQNSP